MSERINPADLVVTLRERPSFFVLGDPLICRHRWEPHLWEHGRAYCPACGSYAEWAKDPRAAP